MLDGIPLLAVTIGFITIFIYIFSRLHLKTIRANWSSMRCDPLVVLIAHLVPDGSDPKINPNDFSIDNFNFCLTQLMDASITQSMNPAMNLLNTQADVAAPINESLNYLRSNATSLLTPLTSMFQSLWNAIKVGMYQLVRSYRSLHSAFDRIFGIVASSIFAGVGMYKAIENLLNFIILIIVIILTILIIIMVFAFFLLFPVMPVIITTLTVISASVFGSAVAGMADSFCVFPGTLVATVDGWKAVEELKPGDALRDGIVEGVLKTTGKGGKYVSVYGIKVSESHLIYDLFEKTWVSAKDHTLAHPIEEEPNFVYCLNTSDHTWIVKRSIEEHTEIILRDWEEIDGCDDLWEKMVFSMLNKQRNIAFFPGVTNPGRGLLSTNTHVWEKSKGYVEISRIEIGDYVKDSYENYTEVLGIYKDTSESMPRSGPNPAVWIWKPDLEMWSHPEDYGFLTEGMGYHLITKSGIFMIDSEEFVRDFTEVGADRIHETYPFVKEFSIHW